MGSSFSTWLKISQPTLIFSFLNFPLLTTNLVSFSTTLTTNFVQVCSSLSFSSPHFYNNTILNFELIRINRHVCELNREEGIEKKAWENNEEVEVENLSIVQKRYLRGIRVVKEKTWRCHESNGKFCICTLS